MKASKGFTLIEVIVSVLITAVMVSSVFSVSLTSKRSNVRADRRLIAAQAARSLTSTLQSYVSADTAQVIIPGPSGGSAPWELPSDTNASNYALSGGSHTLQNIAPLYVPYWFQAPPYNAQLIYYVQYMGSGAADQQTPWVNVTVTWTEP
jgi:prepilin-type N-terminal cleavage/methylation domain-containing protein